ncbi:MAG: hypothetical protein HQK77_15375 [Desulfobacterales bacterium]|nr:hypothetical protein [Desulfobacterales bacterium]
MNNLMKIKDLVQGLVDTGITKVENINKAILDMPFSMLEKIEFAESTAKSAKKITDDTIGSVYETIRKVNKEVGEYASELLGGKEKSAEISEKTSKEK